MKLENENTQYLSDPKEYFGIFQPNRYPLFQ